MKAVVQRVTAAAVEVEGRPVAEIGPGLLALVAIELGDGARDRDRMADKLVHLRIFPDETGRMNRSLAETGGAMLLVSNFTVAGDTRKGRRPSYDGAMRPPGAEPAFGELVGAVRSLGVPVETGIFGAEMLLKIHNDGPVTLVVNSRD